MKSFCSSQLILTAILLCLIKIPLFTQDTLDHKLFIKEIENSSDNIYNSCIKKYNNYLNVNPNDINVHIEKCKFIQFALYDENEEYNPNQAEFDSCSEELIKRFPEHPDVLLFQTTYLWAEELELVFEQAEKSVIKDPQYWSPDKLGRLYLQISDHYYYDSDLKKAYTYIKKAISVDLKYKYSLEYAKILVDLGKKKEALNALVSEIDTTLEMWELSQKADLLLKLEAFSEALNIYNYIDKKDSTYNSKSELANTLEGVGQYNFARKYRIADTSSNWNKEYAIRNLFFHDLKYQDGEKCIDTYNKFRDIGFSIDPIGLYRIRLFLIHPFLSWKFRDVPAIFLLITVLFLLILIPYVWILPVYFIGHRWKFLNKPKAYKSDWGLKLFWFVSAGYLIASFISFVFEPEFLYNIFNSLNYEYELSDFKKGLMYVVFIIIFAVIGFLSLYKVNGRVLLSENWTIKKTIFLSLGMFVLYKIVTAVYIRLGAMVNIGIGQNDIAGIPNILLASKQDVNSLLLVTGKGIGFALICFLVPFYEEVIFRGVVLDSCQRYINFNAANLIQSSLFATIHMDLFLFPVFFLFGIITGIMRKRSGGLLPGIVFHVVNNVLATSVLLIRS